MKYTKEKNICKIHKILRRKRMKSTKGRSRTKDESARYT